MSAWLRLYGPTTLTWGFLAWRIFSTRRLSRDPMRIAVLLALSGLAVSQTVNTPVAYEWIGRFTSVPNLARLLCHASMLLVIGALQAFLFHMTYPPAQARARAVRTVGWLAGAVAAMTVFFVLAPTPVNDVRFASRYADTPWVLEYWLVYLACMAPASFRWVRLGWRYSNLANGPALRWGVRLAVIGTVDALAYHVHRMLFFVQHRFDLPYLGPGPRALVEMFLPPLAHVLIVAGFTMPVWGPRMPHMVAWLRQYRVYHGLGPLWLALYRAAPQIALAPPTSRLVELLWPRDLGLRLYRRVVEIRDGRLALLPYLDVDAAAAAYGRAAATGVSGRKLDALAEAALLSAALRAKAGGADPVGSWAPPLVPGGGDLDSDIAFLEDVARAFRRQPC
ncbi:MAB_1171c family putative transporter [Microbispora siamensis]|uniref:DUF6545 domain-containing protein n=1 Tax=Microbispora siamensis TaxID=564413 RepID=A0ABQ4GTG9_9ACTN|nr:MAB_1171c family putative transporter [Microbispora siamensis]GIH64696.1 hypothetical protein Msi02_55130 [Microbispora siamensis]